MLTKEMLSYIAENIEDIKRIIRDLCAIPAPSHHEEKRAEYCKAWFRANGFEDVEIDEALNVVCRYQVTDENDLVVFMAHTDTVFPDTEPMPFREDEKKMYAPGVCDDTANLAVMMVSARYFVQRKLRAKCGLLIYYLSSIINTIYTMKVPQKEGVKTTYNVGVIEGGTSVNTIAQEASMLCEYRSNDRECLETMRVFFEKTFEAYRAMGVEVEVELVGDRPCGGDVPQEKLDALIARADSAVRELFDAEPIHGPSSTDANIPLAAGIPAICVSAAVGRGCHTRQEEIDLDQLPNGAKLSMRLMQEYFEI